MQLRLIAASDMVPFVDSLIAAQRIAGPQKRAGAVAFDDLSAGRELRLEYTTTTLPPKKFVMPPRERLFSFSRGDTLEVTAPAAPEPLVLFGVHPCDLAALQLLNRAMTDTHCDPNWAARWESLTLVGVDCMPDEWCFCASMGTCKPVAGFDLFLTDVGDDYVVQIGSDEGRALLEAHATVKDATGAEQALAEFEEQKLRSFSKSLTVEKKQLPLLFTKLQDSPVWEAQAKSCLACGTCNLACPTCFCFDVWDTMELNMREGSRSRRWDGCLLKDFAAVASGENFREESSGRFRHRYFRKFDYLPTRLEGLYCVGCARCSSRCWRTATTSAA